MTNALNKDAGHPAQSHSLISVFVGRCKLGSLLGPKIILAASKVKKKTDVGIERVRVSVNH